MNFLLSSAKRQLLRGSWKLDSLSDDEEKHIFKALNSSLRKYSGCQLALYVEHCLVNKIPGGRTAEEEGPVRFLLLHPRLGSLSLRVECKQ